MYPRKMGAKKSRLTHHLKDMTQSKRKSDYQTPKKILAKTANQILTCNSTEARRQFGPPISRPCVTNCCPMTQFIPSRSICHVQNASSLNSSKAINQAETAMS